MIKNNENENLAVINFIKKIYSNKKFIPLHEPIFLGNEKNMLMNVLNLLLFLQWVNLLMNLKKK